MAHTKVFKIGSISIFATKFYIQNALSSNWCIEAIKKMQWSANKTSHHKSFRALQCDSLSNSQQSKFCTRATAWAFECWLTVKMRISERTYAVTCMRIRAQGNCALHDKKKQAKSAATAASRNDQLCMRCCS